MTFPGPPRLPIRNHLAGRAYELTSAGDLNPDQATLARIVSICNEPKVYDWLFREALGGRPYEEAKARQWLEWSGAGWIGGTHFVFAVLDESGNIAAACDIKSEGPVAEIGYWASAGHRGIMTNAVKAMCAWAAEAGFAALFARTKPGNRESQSVLERAGFVRGPDQSDGYARFELSLKEGTRPTEPSVAVRRFRGHEWPIYRGLRLRALADSPDAFGSTLALEQDRPNEAWEARLTSGVTSLHDLPLLALSDNQPAGLTWAKTDQADPRRINLYQMWVAPEFRGHGLGGLLLRNAIAWARTQGSLEMRLGATVHNSPAMHLYCQAGFKPDGPPEPLRPGSGPLSQAMILHLDHRSA